MTTLTSRWLPQQPRRKPRRLLNSANPFCTCWRNPPRKRTILILSFLFLWTILQLPSLVFKPPLPDFVHPMYRRRSKCGTSNSVYAPSKQLIQQSIQQINQGPASHRIKKNEAAAICVLQKDEDLYLLEWINYHLALGFDDIYIFDDGRNLGFNSTDRVHVLPVATNFPKGTHKQIAVYNSCVEVIRQRQPHYNTSIVALLDVDEFLVLRQHNSVQEFMNDKCPRDRCGSMVVNWLWFGTGGNQTNYADEPVLSRFRLRDPVPHTTVKSLFRLEHFYCVTNQHFVHLTFDPMTMTQQQQPHPQQLKAPFSYDTHGNITFQAAFTPDHPYMDVASVHHYTKSMEEWYVRRCVRGDVVKFDLRCTGAYPDAGSVYDTSALDFYEQKVPEGVRQWSNRQSPNGALESSSSVSCPPPFVCSLRIDRPWVTHDPSKFNVREIVPLNSFQ